MTGSVKYISAESTLYNNLQFSLLINRFYNNNPVNVIIKFFSSCFSQRERTSGRASRPQVFGDRHGDRSRPGRRRPRHQPSRLAHVQGQLRGKVLRPLRCHCLVYPYRGRQRGQVDRKGLRGYVPRL
jgi:hypothetical protein